MLDELRCRIAVADLHDRSTRVRSDVDGDRHGEVRSVVAQLEAHASRRAPGTCARGHDDLEEVLERQLCRNAPSDRRTRHGDVGSALLLPARHRCHLCAATVEREAHAPERCLTRKQHRLGARPHGTRSGDSADATDFVCRPREDEWSSGRRRRRRLRLRGRCRIRRRDSRRRRRGCVRCARERCGSDDGGGEYVGEKRPHREHGCERDHPELRRQQLARLARECRRGQRALILGDDGVGEVGELHRHEETALGLMQPHAHAVDLDHLVVLHGERVHVIVIRENPRRDALVFRLGDFLDDRCPPVSHRRRGLLRRVGDLLAH